MVREDNFAVAIIAENRPGVIRAVTDAMAAQDYTMHGIRIHMREGASGKEQEPLLEIELEVSSKGKIDRASVMETVRGMDGVLRADSL